MIFNVLAATSFVTKIDREICEYYTINREFVRNMLDQFSTSHLMDNERVIDEIDRNEKLFEKFMDWLRTNKGFQSCEPWRVPSMDTNGYQPLLGLGFEIKDDDPIFIKWKLSRS